MAYGTKDLKHITWALPVELYEGETMVYGKKEG